jgi:Electron transfer DM13
VRRRRATWVALLLVVALATAFGLYWFQPWKLWTNHRVDDALPAVATAPLVTRSVAATEPTPGPRPPTAVLLSRGTFISHEHRTSGTVSVVRQPNGKRILAIADLRTSEGPVVKVWLTDRRVTKGGWHSFDDGKYVDLGSLKGNLGNQLYPIPDSADLSTLQSVTIWCDRFDVSFGAANLERVP